MVPCRALYEGRYGALYGGDLRRVGVQALGAAAGQPGEARQQIAERVDLADGEAAPADGRAADRHPHRGCAGSRPLPARTPPRPPPSCRPPRSWRRGPRRGPRARRRDGGWSWGSGWSVRRRAWPCRRPRRPAGRRPGPAGRPWASSVRCGGVRCERVHDRRDLAFGRTAAYPQGVEEPSLRIALHGGGGPHPAGARCLDGQHAGGRRAVRELDEGTRHAVRAQQLTYVRPAAYARCRGPGGGRRRHGNARAVQHGMAQPLVEQHRQLVGVVEQGAARRSPAHFPYGPGEPLVPARRSLHPGAVADAPQQPLDLGVLAGRVDPYVSPGRKAAPFVSTSSQGTTRAAGSPAAVTASRNSATRRLAGLPTTAKRAGGCFRYSSTAT